MRTVLVKGLLVLVAVGLVTSCAADGTSASRSPRIVVTTSILGDVVANLVGDDAQVEVVMPRGADPHEFAASARQVAALREADVVVANGLGFEVGLVDALEAAAADGVTILTAADAIEPLARQDGDGADPHFFTDPARMADVAAALADGLAEHVDGLDSAGYRARVARYLDELEALDAEVEAILATIPADRRVLVTNHEVFGYFADRYRFEVLGAIIPGGTTLAEPSAAELRALADAIVERGVPAIFAETSSPTRLAEALAAEGADVEVEVVELYSESLGPEDGDGATYLDMIRTNARRIAAALG